MAMPWLELPSFASSSGKGVKPPNGALPQADGFAIARRLHGGVDDEVALGVLRVELQEARLVAFPAALAEVVGGLQAQVAFEHVERARHVAQGAAEQAVARTAGAPDVGQADVAAVGVVGHAPAAGGHGAGREAAPVLVRDAEVALVEPALQVDVTVAPALAEQTERLPAQADVLLEAQVGLEQRDVRGGGAVFLAEGDVVGPHAVARLAGFALAVLADVGGAADLGLAEAGQAERTEVDREHRRAGERGGQRHGAGDGRCAAVAGVGAGQGGLAP